MVSVASQVQPFLIEKETTFIFANTFFEPYYDKMIENVMRNFTEMVWLGELVEHGIKNKKIERKSTPTKPVTKTNKAKKKEGDVHAVFTNQ